MDRPVCHRPAGRAGGGGDLDERRAPGRAGGIHPALAPVGQRRTAKRRCNIAASRWARWSNWASTQPTKASARARGGGQHGAAQRPGVGAAGHLGADRADLCRAARRRRPALARPGRRAAADAAIAVAADTTNKLPAALGERANWVSAESLAGRRQPPRAGQPAGQSEPLFGAAAGAGRAIHRHLASARQLADELRQPSQGLRAVLAQAGPPSVRPAPPEPGHLALAGSTGQPGRATPPRRWMA